MRGLDKRKLRKYENSEIPLDCEQDGELTDVVSIIDQQFPEELEKIYAEAEIHGLGSKFREVWSIDAKRDKSDFFKDQSQNGKQFLTYLVFKFLPAATGKKSNKWSYITIRIGIFFMQM